VVVEPEEAAVEVFAIVSGVLVLLSIAENTVDGGLILV
jgi:hypothetical protein